MKVPRKKDIPHKLAMYRLLDKLLCNSFVVNRIYFKGGTCASMLGWLDRFSVGLDFDLIDKKEKNKIRKEIYKIIKDLDFEIKDESKKHPQFFLKYRDVVNERNTLKLEITDIVSKENQYKKFYLAEIDRYCQAQTIETMFANKLVVLKARWEEGKSIAGRDLYDIYYFFNQGFDINKEVIKDLRGKPLKEYAGELSSFIQENISEDMLMRDLNTLMDTDRLKKILPRIKKEALIGLNSLVGG